MRMLILSILFFGSFINYIKAHKIHFAAMHNIITEIKANIKFKDQIDEFGYKPIHYAAQYNQFNAIKELVTNGAYINATTYNEGFTASHLVGQFGNELIMDFLFKNNANINAQDKITLATPIQYSIAQNNMSTFMYLLNNNECNLHVYDKYGRNILHWAIMYGRTLIVQAILKNDATKDLQYDKDFSDYTPLQMALENYQSMQYYTSPGVDCYDISLDLSNIIKFFLNTDSVQISSSELPKNFAHKQYSEYSYLKAASKPNTTQDNELKQTYSDSSSSSISHVSDKVENNVEINSQECILEEFQTILPEVDNSQAIQFQFGSRNPNGPRDPKKAKELIQPQDDLHAVQQPISHDEKACQDQEWQDETKLNRAQKKKKKNGKTINNYIAAVTSQDGLSVAKIEKPILQESEETQKEILVEKVVKKKKKKKNSSGNTPLHNAIISKQVNYDDLIDFDSVNTPNNAGDFPLHLAIKLQSNFLKEILQAGADVNNQDSHGLRALDYAQNAAIMDLLLEFNADIYLLSQEKQQQIFTLATQEKNKKFKYLSNLTATSLQASSGNTKSLLYNKFLKAIKGGNFKTVMKLAEENSELLYIKDESARLPIHIAVDKKTDTEDVLKILEYLMLKAPETFEMPDQNGNSAYDLLMKNCNLTLCVHIVTRIKLMKIFDKFEYLLPKIYQYCINGMQNNIEYKKNYKVILEVIKMNNTDLAKFQ